MKSEYKTKSRNLIIDYMKNNINKRFTARDVLDGIRCEGEELDRSTVYRNLERLCKEGRLVKFKDTDINAACYQYTEDNCLCHQHMHAQCSKCGKIFHIDNKMIKDMSDRMKSEYGIIIDYGKTVIACVCSSCSNK